MQGSSGLLQIEKRGKGSPKGKCHSKDKKAKDYNKGQYSGALLVHEKEDRENELVKPKAESGERMEEKPTVGDKTWSLAQKT
jgi:hypothetical protein